MQASYVPKSPTSVGEGIWGRIVLHLLPPYSPEHNPIERLWKEVHANVTRNHRCRTIEVLANVDYFL